MHDAMKRPIVLRVSTWGPTGEGLRFAEFDLAETFGSDVAILGVTIEDGDREVVYDTENYSVTLTKDDREVPDFDDDPVPVAV